MAITINRVYTRSGDKGETSLVDGSRVPKDNLRCEAFGTIDELNSILGICKEHIESPYSQDLHALFEMLQQELFDIGSELATPTNYTYPNKWESNEVHIKKLENLCDTFNRDLAELKSFILPGGSLLASYLHLARTVCRRGERVIVKLSREEKLNPCITIYVNRLSDLLFVLSRYVLAERNLRVPEWVQEKDRKN